MASEERKFRGLNMKLLTYDCGEDSWKINPDGHLPKYAKKIQDIVADFDKLTADLQSGKIKDTAAQKKAQEQTRQILEVCLLPTQAGNPKGFNFDEAVEKYGWRTMDGIAIDLKRLFLEHGGVDEMKLWKQRLNEATRNGFVGIEI